MAIANINISEIKFLPKPTVHNFRDIEGQAFGRLTALGITRKKSKKVAWLCQCKCGNFTEVFTSDLTRGNTRSCGCLLKETIAAVNFKHGQSMSIEARTWYRMRGRCNNPTHPDYVNYGGRGITVCPRWEESFDAFLEDMGLRPSLHHSIERLDVNSNYDPTNCIWATRIKQANNKRSNRRVTYQGKTQSLADWCRELHLNRRLIYRRLWDGWSFEKAITTPKLLNQFG